MTYPELTNMSAAILPDMMRYSSTVTNGWFGFGILAIVWIVLFLNLMFAERNKAISTATLVVGILSIPLRLMSVVSDSVMFGALVCAALSIFWMLFTKEDV